MTCASVTNLQNIKDVTEADARLIRKVWSLMGATQTRAYLLRPAINLNGRFSSLADTAKGSANLKQGAIDIILGTHGVEYLGQRKGNREHVYYCNAGDTYATTVLFDGLHLRVGDIGNLIERNLISERHSDF